MAALAAIPDDGPITELRKQVCAVFADAQRYAATQRKHAIRLRRIQESVCMSGADAPAEQAFGAELGRCLLRILAIRKGETAGDRLVKFVALFLSLAGEKGGFD